MHPKGAKEAMLLLLKLMQVKPALLLSPTKILFLKEPYLLYWIRQE